MEFHLAIFFAEPPVYFDTLK